MLINNDPVHELNNTARNHHVKKLSQPISRVLSRTVIHLGHTLLYASSNLPVFNASHALTSNLSSRNEHLFGLAPSGVYPAARVTTNAVRSYRTISPLLSKKNSKRGIAGKNPNMSWSLACFSKKLSGIFLLHLPSAYAAQTLSGTLLFGARTFLPLLRSGDCPVDSSRSLLKLPLFSKGHEPTKLEINGLLSA